MNWMKKGLNEDCFSIFYLSSCFPKILLLLTWPHFPKYRDPYLSSIQFYSFNVRALFIFFFFFIIIQSLFGFVIQTSVVIPVPHCFCHSHFKSAFSGLESELVTEILNSSGSVPVPWLPSLEKFPLLWQQVAVTLYFPFFRQFSMSYLFTLQ